MPYLNGYTSRKYIIACALLFTLSSCGTTERATSSKEAPPGGIENSLPSADDSPSDKKSEAPPTKVLVSPAELDAEAVKLIENGRASWYGPKFHGRLTANGEKYDMHGMTAAHRTLPFNTLVLVKNIDSGRAVTVRINDRGPFAKNRIIDLSKKAAKEIGMIGPGTARVELYVPKQSVDPSRSSNLTTPTYTVQLGSFKTEAQAFNHSSKISGSRVEIIRTNDTTVYRVYYGLYIDKDKAYEKQQALQRRNFSGFVKQIENG